MMQKLKNNDFLWNTLGNLLVSFLSMILMLIVIRINGIDKSGILNYGFTIAVIFYSIGIFCGRTFQVSDKNNDIEDGHFVNSRYLSTFISLILVILYLIINDYRLEKIVIIGFLCIYKLIESISDVYHGILQKNNKLYLSGQLLCIRTICALVLFILIDYFTKSIVLSELFLLINNVIFLFLDIHLAHKYYNKLKFNKKKALKYFTLAFSPFILNFLVLFAFSIPRYIIDYKLSDSIQAIYGIIIMPASLISLMGHMIIQPSIMDITNMIKSKEYDRLKKLIVKLCGYCILICIILILGTITFGIPILNFVYGIKLDSQLINILLIILGSLFYMIIILISNVLIVMRKFKIQIDIYVISTIFGFIISYLLITNYNLFGAVLSYLIIMFVELIMFIFTYKHYTSPNYYKKINNKKVAFLRSTSILNDSRATKEIKTLLKAGYKVTVFGWDRDLSVKDNEISELDNSAKLILYKRKSLYGGDLKVIVNMLFYELWLIRKLIKFHNEFSIIHACDFDTGFIGKIISNIYNKFLVYDMYDYFIESRPMPKLIQNIVEHEEISIINNADFSIICSEWRLNQIKKSNPKKVVIIHNTPQIDEKFKKEKSLLKSKSTKIKIAYIGILQDNRLIKEIIDEFKGDNNVELHIGGFGMYENYIIKQSQKYKNIYFYGNLKYDEVLNIESKVDLLFATYNPTIKNHKYSAPNKVYEAMALKKPVIVCKGTGIDIMVSKNKIGETINYDSSEFRKALNNIFIKNKNKLETLKNNTYNLYENKYSWKIMAKKLIDAYGNLTEE